MGLNFAKVSPWNPPLECIESMDEDGREVIAMHQRARSYIEHFAWCKSIVEEYVGFVEPGVFAVFLFKIEPARQNVDEWIWVIVGDLPPAYITCEICPNPAAALDGYIGAMRKWVDAVNEGRPTDHLIPVNAAPTLANAKELKRRLDLLDAVLLSDFAEDLKE